MSEVVESPEGSCSNPDCRVSETAQCLEGLELDACPHFGPASEARSPEEDQDDQQSVANGDSIQLPTGTVLNFEEASRVLRSKDARVVAVLGPTDSGKTSLIAGVYEIFQTGTVGDIRFSRSETLHAFERICHDARSASRRSGPTMMRTPVGSVAFYHLELSRQDRPISLLLADRAGEEYSSAADDLAVVDGFAEIGRADSISILVDGEKLLSGARHNMGSELKMMLQALKEGNGLLNDLSLAVVLTKLDEVESSSQRDHGMRVFDRLVAEVKRLFGESFAAVEVFRVAASPKTTGAEKGEGLDQLLAFWLSKRRVVPTDCGKEVVPLRAFGRLRYQDPHENDES